MPDRGDPRVHAGAVGAGQAGPTLQILVSGDPTVGQVIPTVSVEARIFGRRAYA